jgi:hypothetical protein
MKLKDKSEKAGLVWGVPSWPFFICGRKKIHRLFLAGAREHRVGIVCSDFVANELEGSKRGCYNKVVSRLMRVDA